MLSILDEAENLSFGKGVKPPFKSIVGKGENAGNHIKDRNHPFSKIKFVICKCFQFRRG